MSTCTTCSKARAEAQVLLQNAERILAIMWKEAASGVTHRVQDTIQLRIQLIQTEEISRPVLVSLAAAVAYTHAQRFKLAQDMIGKAINDQRVRSPSDRSSVAEIFCLARTRTVHRGKQFWRRYCRPLLGRCCERMQPCASAEQRVLAGTLVESPNTLLHQRQVQRGQRQVRTRCTHGDGVPA